MQPEGTLIHELPEKHLPRILAPRPIYNSLQNRMVKLCSYSLGTGLESPDGDMHETSFVDIDVDLWARQFLTALDTNLSPATRASIEMVGRLAETPQDFLERFQDSKASLADSISKLMIPVYRDEPADRENDSREIFRRAMLEELTNAYAVDAAIQLTSRATDSAPQTLLFTARSQPGGVVTSFDSFRESERAFEVPIVRRSFPTPPTFCSHCDPTSGKREPGPCVDLDELTRWRYSFTYSEVRHYPQDRAYFEVTFNVEDRDGAEDPMREEAPEQHQHQDLVHNLAQFAALFPAIDADLAEFLPRITAESEPWEVNRVATALDAFATLTEWVARAWESATPSTGAPCLASSAAGHRGLFTTIAAAAMDALAAVAEWIDRGWKPAVTRMGASAPTSNAASPYAFSIVESAREPGNDASPLVITLRESVVRPERVGQPMICIPDCDTTLEPVSAPSHGPAEFRYTFSKGGSPLTAKEGLRIAGRRVSLPDMVPFERQNALVAGYLTRNVELVPGMFSADDFVYRTATVTCAEPVLPFIDLDTRLDIARVGVNKPQIRSLAGHLASMFDNLFEFESPHVGSRTIKLACYYEYSVAPELPCVSIPMFLLDQFEFSKATDTKVPGGDCRAGDAESLVCLVTNELTDWLDRQKPVSTDGKFRLELSVFSTLSKQPLIRLGNLEIGLDYVSTLPASEPAANGSATPEPGAAGHESPAGAAAAQSGRHTR